MASKVPTAVIAKTTLSPMIKRDSAESNTPDLKDKLFITYLLNVTDNQVSTIYCRSSAKCCKSVFFCSKSLICCGEGNFWRSLVLKKPLQT